MIFGFIFIFSIPNKKINITSKKIGCNTASFRKWNHIQIIFCSEYFIKYLFDMVQIFV